MSYCRFSSNDYDCDVYLYMSCYGGWQGSLAGNRAIFDRSALPHDTEDIFGHLARHEAMMRALKTCKRELIALPRVGEDFHCDTIGELKAELLELRRIGYRFPDYVLAMVDAEIAEYGTEWRGEKEE